MVTAVQHHFAETRWLPKCSPLHLLQLDVAGFQIGALGVVGVAVHGLLLRRLKVAQGTKIRVQCQMVVRVVFKTGLCLKQGEKTKRSST